VANSENYGQRRTEGEFVRGGRIKERKEMERIRRKEPIFHS